MVERVLRYSEAFKLEVVRQLETGELSGIEQAKQRYGIGGSETIQCWLRRYGRNHLLPKVVRVEKPNERDEMKRLRQENERLKQALADSHMDALLYQSWLEIACRQFGVEDVEGFKKKLAEK